LNRDQSFIQISSKYHLNMLLKIDKTKFKRSLCIWPFRPESPARSAASKLLSRVHSAHQRKLAHDLAVLGARALSKCRGPFFCVHARGPRPTRVGPLLNILHSARGPEAMAGPRPAMRSACACSPAPRPQPGPGPGNLSPAWAKSSPSTPGAI
jgi:hypothetical protein